MLANKGQTYLHLIYHPHSFFCVLMPLGKRLTRGDSGDLHLDTSTRQIIELGVLEEFKQNVNGFGIVAAVRMIAGEAVTFEKRI